MDHALESAPKVADNATQIYATPRAARLLEDAKNEADRLKDDFIGAEHLFIAAVTESQGDAAQILKEHDVDQEKVYQALVEAGCSPEAVMLDLYASGESVKFAEYGRDLGAFERMKRASQTAQFGHLVWSKKYFDEEKTMEGMREMLTNIKDGSFIKALKEERTKNSRQVDEVWKDNNEHELVKREHELYKLLGRRSKDTPAPGGK